MTTVNHAKKEISAKIVYYGPESMGKGASLYHVYNRIRKHLRGELKQVPASGFSLLFFDFSPFEYPIIGDYHLRIHLYTLLGRVENPAAWRMTLKGADGLVFVADASPENIQLRMNSIEQLREILSGYGVGLNGDIPIALQLNASPCADRSVLESVASELGLEGCYSFAASILDGQGVLEVLTGLAQRVIYLIMERGHVSRSQPISDDVAKAEAVLRDTLLNVSNSKDDTAWNMSPSFRGHEADSELAQPESLSVVQGGVRVDESRVVIPLDVCLSGGVRQRLTLTVMIASG